ncbi:MAG: hypothetical protein ACRYHQ_08075 [Janthinobacterium lividum]
MPDPAAFDRQPRAAIAALSEEARAAWRTRYCTGEGAELRALALLERTERELRVTGAETTIHALWVALVDRAGREGEADMGVAAALEGMAMGLAGVG